MAKMVRIRVPEPFWTKVTAAAFVLYGYEGQEVSYLQGIMAGNVPKTPTNQPKPLVKEKIKKPKVEVRSDYNKMILVYCANTANNGTEVYSKEKEIEDFFKSAKGVCDMFPEARELLEKMYILETDLYRDPFEDDAVTAACRFKRLQLEYNDAKREALRIQIPDEVTYRPLEGQPTDGVRIEDLPKGPKK